MIGAPSPRKKKEFRLLMSGFGRGTSLFDDCLDFNATIKKTKLDKCVNKVANKKNVCLLEFYEILLMVSRRCANDF